MGKEGTWGRGPMAERGTEAGSGWTTCGTSRECGWDRKPGEAGSEGGSGGGVLEGQDLILKGRGSHGRFWSRRYWL